jgi:predicted nuclease of restriction endonuclease-like (RecB) superfamily
VRELERQTNSGIFERAILGNTKPPFVTELAPNLSSPFKDHYVFEFLNLPEPHTEKDLQKAILQNLKKFLLEFSRDFAFLGEEFTIQVGNKDFSLDLIFFNRALNSLVAIELKVVEFIPEHLGKLNFYLEALDRDVKKTHENPSIGILLCKSKDDEVVEYAMSRQLIAAMVAKYQLQLPDKKLLQAKLHEFFEGTQKFSNYRK